MYSLFRFFSICGIITTQRNQNSNEDLFIDRAMLCANLKLLEKLKIPEKEERTIYNSINNF
jgi:hypothetical protein